MTRLSRDWRALTGEQRLAAGSAVALFLTMLLPWYQQNAVISAPRTTPLQSRNLNAFQVFTFVEAAVLLVALAVLYLLYARAEGRHFHLPGSDGAVVMAAGLWTALLLVFRLFDKPGISSHGIAANVGVQWGIFFALLASGLMAYAGSRMRATRRPETPLVRSPEAPSGAEPSRASEPPREPSRPAERPRRPPPPAGRPAGPSPRPVAAAKHSEQLSFEDHPPTGD
ncbi:MAG TPA: hypothetical protein VL972_02860 [Solirubrobacteraceae bacterium]|nr:hypothetical protein [Solirubrobacteraceae bacterium]